MINPSIAGPSIRLNQVCFRAGTILLLNDISCDFIRGGWYGIVGPNGGGKSTLIQTILGLNNHTGKIEISWPTNDASPGKIGYVPQLIPFDDSLPISVRDYLLMSLSSKPIWFKRRIPEETKDALTQINLLDKLERKIGDLSGGERQRLMLMTALLQQPGLLILDEPMTGLDSEGKAQSLQLLTRFKQAGGTIIMIEHDWEIVKSCCDEVYLVDQTLELINLDNIGSPNTTHLFHSQGVFDSLKRGAQS